MVVVVVPVVLPSLSTLVVVLWYDRAALFRRWASRAMASACPLVDGPRTSQVRLSPFKINAQQFGGSARAAETSISDAVTSRIVFIVFLLFRCPDPPGQHWGNKAGCLAVFEHAAKSPSGGLDGAVGEGRFHNHIAPINTPFTSTTWTTFGSV